MSVSALRNSSNSEPRILLAGALAVLVHLVFIAVLIFGLNWKDQQPEGMMVEIWTELPAPIQESVKTQSPPKQIKPAPEPVKPKPAPEPERPKPEPVKPEPAKPAPQQAAVTPPVKKPDIAMQQKPEPIKETKPDLELQKKQEQERLKELEKQKELEKKKELEKQKELERQKELAKQKELEKQKELQKQKELAAQQQREQAAKAQREAEAQRAAQQAAARNQITNEISKYKALIQAKIRSRIVMPPDLPGNPIAEFSITLLPGGDILEVRLSKSSGYAVFDNAVERAIHLSKPLPLPPDPALFNEFRNLNITVHYRE